MVNYNYFDVLSESRTADELIQMIAHFYYNAKKPSWIKDSALNPAYKF